MTELFAEVLRGYTDTWLITWLPRMVTRNIVIHMCRGAVWKVKKTQELIIFFAEKGRKINDANTKPIVNGSISSSYSVIVRVRVVLERTVVGDWRFENRSGSHLQSQVNSVYQSMVSGSLSVIGQFSHDGIGWKTHVKIVSSHWPVLASFDPSILSQITPGPGIEPGTHWWEASALTTTPHQLPGVFEVRLLLFTWRWRWPAYVVKTSVIATRRITWPTVNNTLSLKSLAVLESLLFYLSS